MKLHTSECILPKYINNLQQVGVNGRLFTNSLL